MTEGGWQLVRYVDDLVVLTKTNTDADQAYHFCRGQLAAMGLTIHPIGEQNEKGKIKTQILGRNQPFDFLGLRFNKETVQPASSKFADLKERIHTATYTRGRLATLVQIVERLNRLLRGWMASYSFCDIPNDLQKQIDHLAGTGLSIWMRSHDLIDNINSLSHENRRKIGLWSTTAADIKPLSRRIRRGEAHVPLVVS